MDWSLFHLLNGSLRGDDPAQDAAELFNAYALFALAGATALTWFLARPGGSLRSKLAAATAVFAGVLGLLANAALGHLWYHARPFVAHPRQTDLLVGHAADNSFPSDHTTVAFAIAVAVLVFHRRLGAFFVVLAALIGIDRIFVGVHYPVDVLAGALVGTAAALVVAFVGRPYVAFTVRLASRITDPLVGAARARAQAARRRVRGS